MSGPQERGGGAKGRTMLLARMAEAVYWAGRYLERAEGTARLVQVHTDTHIDMPVGRDVGWEPLLVGGRARHRLLRFVTPKGRCQAAGK